MPNTSKYGVVSCISTRALESESALGVVELEVFSRSWSRESKVNPEMELESKVNMVTPKNN